jgi:hypothetical protein
MLRFAGTEYAIEFQQESFEPAQLQWEFHVYLSEAGWILKGHPAPRFSLSFGIEIFTLAERNAVIPESPAALALAEWLDERQIPAYTSLVSRGNHHEPCMVLLRIGPRPETIGQHDHLRSLYAKQKAIRGTT